MSFHHKEASTNNHVIAVMRQAEAVVRYLMIKGVSVKGVILRNCTPVICIEHHKLCEQLLKNGQADYITFGKNAQGGFKQGAFMKGGCRVIWSTSLH
ncbi:MAG: hypothetical protein ACMX3H_18705 [Sodalis sp. (in: enterobacteria)]|uniref:hypothetical protein n=1 Tax=Sodalis sp. (in: enterobacteria) TaxID=1898979 RepID=UPI0039E38295